MITVLLQCSERSIEIKIKCIFIKVYDLVRVVQNENITVHKYRHIGATYMDVVFRYNEAITNAQCLMDRTTRHVASQSSPMS